MLYEPATFVLGEVFCCRRGRAAIPTATSLPVYTPKHITFAFLLSDPPDALFFEIPRCVTELDSQTAEARGMRFQRGWATP